MLRHPRHRVVVVGVAGGRVGGRLPAVRGLPVRATNTHEYHISIASRLTPHGRDTIRRREGRGGCVRGRCVRQCGAAGGGDP